MQGLTIHQIWYRDEQQPVLDGRLKHWDNRENLRPEWCEYWIMRQAYQQFEQHFDSLTGFFSWKFKEKLGIDVAQIEGLIQAHPGADCYIFSPAVFQVAFYRNVWHQAEVWHPGMTRIAQNLLEALGHHIDLANSIDHHLSTAYANYWIGSRPFWQAYFNFMEPVFAHIEEKKDKPDSPFWQHRYGSTGGQGHVQSLPIIPYLVERLFSVFVKQHPQFKIVAWEFPLDVLQQRAFRAASMIPIANWCKLMYQQTQQELYLTFFAHLQGEMVRAVNQSLGEHPGAVIC